MANAVNEATPEKSTGAGILDILSGKDSFKTENVITFDNTIYYVLGFAFLLVVVYVLFKRSIAK